MCILKTLVENTPGTVGAIIVDWEGEAVQEFCHCGQFEIRFLGAHLEIILNRFRTVHQANDEEIQDVMLTTSANTLIIGCINKEYSLAMHVDRNCLPALALKKFRQALSELMKEI